MRPLSNCSWPSQGAEPNCPSSSLTSSLRQGGGNGNLWLSESAEADQSVEAPTETWRRVAGFMVSTDESMGYLRCRVLLQREGTHIRLESSGMPPDQLIDLARSLVPLS